MNRLVLVIAAAGLGSALLPSISLAQDSAPESQVNALEGVAGKQPGFRRSQAKGESRFVRWQFVPEAGTIGLSDEQLKLMPDDFLADELHKRVAVKPVAFEFKVQLAEPGDALTDPTQIWPDSRFLVTARRLVIDKVEAGPGGACENVMFSPLVLPKGIKPSADPVLLARTTAYIVSLTRRLGEVRK